MTARKNNRVRKVRVSNQTKHPALEQEKPRHPFDELLGVVGMINTYGRTPPANALIHRGPSETIAACKQMIEWMGDVGHRSDSDASMYVLRTIVDALEHARVDTAIIHGAATELYQRRVETLQQLQQMTKGRANA